MTIGSPHEFRLPFVETGPTAGPEQLSAPLAEPNLSQH
jgi:hypothetical protein